MVNKRKVTEKNHNSWLFEKKKEKPHSLKPDQEILIKVFVPRTRIVQTNNPDYTRKLFILI